MVVTVVVVMMMMMVVLALVSMGVKVFRESDFEVHGARDGIYRGYTDCGVFTNRGGLGLGTDRGTIFWNGGCIFGVHNWC